MDLETDQDYARVLSGLKKLPDFDKEAFITLTEDTDEQVILKILARYSVTLSESLEQINEGIKEDNGEKIWRACHKVAGSAELLGFRGFGTHSRALNMSLKTMTDPHIHMNEIQTYSQEGYQLLRSIEVIFPNLRTYL